MHSIPATAQVLLGSDAVAHLWTSNPNGSPQVSVVWVIAQDDKILFGTDVNSRKAKNLALNPNVVMSIEDTERSARGFQRHLVIRGQATIQQGPNPALMDQMAMKYAGLARHPLAMRDSTDCAVVTVTIDRISGVGPWIQDEADQLDTSSI